MAIQPNNDFFNEPPQEKPKQGSIPKMDLPSKKKKDAKTKKDTKVGANNKKQQLKETISDEEMDSIRKQYPEYFALSDYHKKCLIATNYWRVMNGMPIIEVPPQYTYYHNYFDKRCYELAKEYQERKSFIEERSKNEQKIVDVLVKVEKQDLDTTEAVIEINKINGITSPVEKEEHNVAPEIIKQDITIKEKEVPAKEPIAEKPKKINKKLSKEMLDDQLISQATNDAEFKKQPKKKKEKKNTDTEVISEPKDKEQKEIVETFLEQTNPNKNTDDKNETKDDNQLSLF